MLEDDLQERIRILSIEDTNLKLLGEILSNESSRSMLVLLTKEEISAAQLSERLQLRLSLVMHHLQKMLDAHIVKITKTTKNHTNRVIKHYSAKDTIIILPAIAASEAKKSKTFFNALQRIMKYCTVVFSTVSILSIKGYLDSLDNSWNSEILFIPYEMISLIMLSGVSYVAYFILSKKRINK